MRVNFVEIENYLVKIGWSMRLVVFNIAVFRVYSKFDIYYTTYNIHIFELIYIE